MLEEASRIRDLAAAGHDPLAGTLRLGAIHTIGPYLLPKLVPILRRRVPAMQLHITESFTHQLAEALRQGEVDVVVVALPFDEAGCVTQAVYDEPFLVAVPVGHPWEKRKRISAEELKRESLLCLAKDIACDQVLEFRAVGRAGRSSIGRSLREDRSKSGRWSRAGRRMRAAFDLGVGACRASELLILPFARRFRVAASPSRGKSYPTRRSSAAKRSLPAICRKWLESSSMPAETPPISAAPSGGARAAQSRARCATCARSGPARGAGRPSAQLPVVIIAAVVLAVLFFAAWRAVVSPPQQERNAAPVRSQASEVRASPRRRLQSRK